MKALLTHVDVYVVNMQAVISQVLAHAPTGQLPEELQWSMRMLLPREGSGTGFTTGPTTGGNGTMTNANPPAPAPAPASAATPGQQNFGAQQAAGQGYNPQQLALMQQVCMGLCAEQQTQIDLWILWGEAVCDRIGSALFITASCVHACSSRG